MSEELADEVEAINSIYGDDSLSRSEDDSDIYILKLPGETSSLRLQFPPTYPAEPLTVLGTHSSSGKRGAAGRELDLFLAAIGTVYQPGQVCLFDAIEEMTRLLETYATDEQEPTPGDVGDSGEGTRSGDALSLIQEHGSLALEPPWVLSDPVTEMKSTFIARCAKVTTSDQALQFTQHLLASDKKVRTAHHNMTAWRIKGPNNTSFQDCNDDGETAAGGRLLHLMQLMDLWDVMVIVTRWYGGQKLGPRRFAVINQVARDAFVKAGLVETAAKKKAHGRS